jgi:hypothetical protein
VDGSLRSQGIRFLEAASRAEHALLGLRRKRTFWALVCGAVALGAVLGCGGENDLSRSLPDGKPTLTGTVRSVHDDRVATKDDRDECGVTLIREGSDAVVLRRAPDGGYGPSSWAALQHGVRVEVWAGDPRATCPAEIVAQAVVVEEGE